MGGDLAARRRAFLALAGSGAGMSGLEAAAALGTSRATAARHLEALEAAGQVRRRRVGSATLWRPAAGARPLEFPADYAAVQGEFAAAVRSLSAGAARSLARACAAWGARADVVAEDVLLPAAAEASRLYDEGKIGDAELGAARSLVRECAWAAAAGAPDPDPGRRALLLAADAGAAVACTAAAASLSYLGWDAADAGDLSHSAGVATDLDLQRALGRAWRGAAGEAAVVVFASGPEAGAFFASSAREALSRAAPGRARLALCGPGGPGRADMSSESLGEVLQWCEAPRGAV